MEKKKTKYKKKKCKKKKKQKKINIKKHKKKKTQTKGASFCAGADLKERRGMKPDEAGEFVYQLRKTFSDFENIPIPTLAAISGFALGGGKLTYIYTYIHTYIHTYMHVYICTYMTYN